MTEGVETIIFSRQGPREGQNLYSTLLGAEHYIDVAYYVGVNVEGQDIGLTPRSQPGHDGPSRLPACLTT